MMSFLTKEQEYSSSWLLWKWEWLNHHYRRDASKLWCRFACNRGKQQKWIFLLFDFDQEVNIFWLLGLVKWIKAAPYQLISIVLWLDIITACYRTKNSEDRMNNVCHRLQTAESDLYKQNLKCRAFPKRIILWAYGTTA